MAANQTNEGLENFSYEKTKEAFEQKQTNYIWRKREELAQGTIQLWTREKVDAYIELLLDYKDNKCQNQETYEYNVKPISELEARYTVIPSDTHPNKNKLVLKLEERCECDVPLEVIPLEECFDVILKMHRIVGHRGPSCTKLYKQVLRKYVIDKIWIKLLLRACNMCQSKIHIIPAPITKKYYKIYQVLFKEVCKYSGPFYMIMIVINKLSNFVQLRPLPNIMVETVALELMKVITDFGVPELIETENVIFGEKVSSMMGKFSKEMKISVVAINPVSVQPWLELVHWHLSEWTEMNDCYDYSLGCQIVQWQINNTVSATSNSSPYKELFHTEPVEEILG